MVEDLNTYLNSYKEEFPYNDENQIMLSEYASRIVERLATIEPPISIIGLGIGHRTVLTSLLERLGKNLRQYILVEGSSEIIAQFKQENHVPENLKLIEGYFETFEPAEPVDAIEMGFVLEHVDDPDEIVRKFKTFLKPGGSLFMAVPNARSLNRLIGYHGGLLKDIYALSEYDYQLGHKRYFDMDSFTNLILRHDVEIVRTEGLYMKPLTSRQMLDAGLPDA